MIYTGPIRLKNATCFYYFATANVLIGVSEYRAPRPIAGGCGNEIAPGVLGTWGGSITVYGYDLHKRCGDIFQLEFAGCEGEILIYKTEPIEDGIKLWFDGMGTPIYMD